MHFDLISENEKMHGNQIITARIRRMGKVMFSVCPHLGGGGVSISHNALQHFPECHGAATGGGGTLVGGYPGRGVPWRGGTLVGGTQVRSPPRQVSQGGTLVGGYPGQVPPPPQPGLAFTQEDFLVL